MSDAAYERRLAAYYGGDPAVADLPHVVRVPGFLHRKKTPELVRLEEGSGSTYTLEEIRAAHPVEEKTPTKRTAAGTTARPVATGTRREKRPVSRATAQSRRVNAEPRSSRSASVDCGKFNKTTNAALLANQSSVTEMILVPRRASARLTNFSKGAA